MLVHPFSLSGYNFFIEEELRSYLRDVEAALVFSGLTRTSDTGQLDIETAIAPTGTQGGGHFKYVYLPLIYLWPGSDGFPDLYIKIEYAVGNRYFNNTSNIPSARVTIGNGTDGACNLTGIVITATANTMGLQGNYVFATDNLGGVIASSGSILSVCVNPGRVSTDNTHKWAVPFFCIQRQTNGDYHCAKIDNPSDLRYTGLPAVKTVLSVDSSINGQLKNLVSPCAFVGMPSTFNGELTVQKFYRHDRELLISEFEPLVSIHNSGYEFGTSFDMVIGSEVLSYMSCGPNVGARVSLATPNEWIPAMRTK